MSLTTFLLVVLAVWVGNRLNLSTFGDTHRWRSETWFSVIFFKKFGWCVFDRRVTQLSNDYGEDDCNYRVTVNQYRIDEYIARGKWYLRLGSYYVFFMNTDEEFTNAKAYSNDHQYLYEYTNKLIAQRDELSASVKELKKRARTAKKTIRTLEEALEE